MRLIPDFTNRLPPLRKRWTICRRGRASTFLCMWMRLRGFIAPFLQPDLVWDFQLPRVKSINVSGHKYGLVYPGLGWIIWREAEDLPEDLIFRVSYLGGNMPTFALNFSRPGAQVLLQYYNYLRLGKSGYYDVQRASQKVALFLVRRFRRWNRSNFCPMVRIFRFSLGD